MENTQKQALESAITHLVEELKDYLAKGIEEAVKKALEGQTHTAIPPKAPVIPPPSIPSPVRVMQGKIIGFTLEELPPLLEYDATSAYTLAQIGERTGHTENSVYNLRSMYFLWKAGKPIASHRLANLFAQYEEAKQTRQTKPLPLPLVVDEEAGGVAGYYLTDLQAYLGEAEFERFEQWFAGKTGGMYQGQMYVFKGDVDNFLKTIANEEKPELPQPVQKAHRGGFVHGRKSWSIDEVELALDAKRNEWETVGQLIGRSTSAIDNLHWRYKVWKKNGSHPSISLRLMEDFKTYEQRKNNEGR